MRCAYWKLIKRSGCIDLPVGVENRALFPDHRFTATSVYSSTYQAHNARFDSKTAWEPKTNTNPNEYLQFDLGTVYTICGLGTQGNYNSVEWTTNYSIQTSMNGKIWSSYRENGAKKIFTGNTGHRSVVTHTLPVATKMRFVRFTPISQFNYKALRIELYGRKEECLQPFRIENKGITDNMMTSSSRVDNSHTASHGRLYGSSSWCSSTTSNTEYIQVDLGQVMTVTGIATQGDPTANKWIMTYSVNYGVNNMTWNEYRGGQANKKVFLGNTNKEEIHVNWLNSKTRARYIRVFAQTWKTSICTRMEIYGCGPNPVTCDFPAGLANSKIVDARITASSEYNSSTTSAANARLNYARGSSWCASTSDSTPYLQIDLGSPYIICAVATQGNSMADQWVKTYQIQGSTDGSTWTTYSEKGQNKVFLGNFDRSTTVKKHLSHSFAVRYLKFLPITSRDGVCMRVEIYGRPKTECANAAIGVRWSGDIPEHRITVTTQYNADFAVHFARLYAPRSWAPSTNTDPNDYLQIDLGDVYILCAIATQGSPASSEWTTTYMISLSVDGNTWVVYKENNANKIEQVECYCLLLDTDWLKEVGMPGAHYQECSYDMGCAPSSGVDVAIFRIRIPALKTFSGNNDKNTVVKNPLIGLPTAKMIQVYPVQYNNYKILRVEVYGFVQECHSSLGFERFLMDVDPTTKLSSSSHSDASHSASRGILYGTSSWCTNVTANQFIQFDLGEYKTITGIVTQGEPGSSSTKWVKSYDLKFGYTTTRWQEYQGFQGNTDGDGIRVQWLVTPIEARYIRLLPKTWNNGICLRVDLYGCDLVLCNNRGLGMETGAIPVQYITSSSKRDSSTPPANARLKYVGGSSWCASTSDSTPYLQIDLGSPHVICAVATQGNSIADDWVESYYLQFSLDDTNWRFFIRGDEVKLFVGNTDCSTVGNHQLDQRTVARFVRFLPISYHGSTCMRVDLYGKVAQPECADLPIGLASRNTILDYRFTSTSTFNTNYRSYRARLGDTTGWAPRTNDQSDYLQVDLGTIYTICAVGTKGDGNANQWATAFQISLSIDNVVWTAYKVNGVIQLFAGNTDRNTLVKNSLPKAASAKFIRFHPTTYNTHKVIRVEIYGVQEACKQPFGMENKGTEDFQILTSSYLDNNHKATHGRLYGSSSWCSSTTSNTEYIQVDLGQMKTVTGIATQGDPNDNKWVKNYVVLYSSDGNSWHKYTAGQTLEKVFSGNRNKSSIAVNWFRYPINGRYIRIIPHKWNSGICLRMELYGCTVSCDNLPLGLERGLVFDSQMTASSLYNGSITAARYARLHYTGGSSWCASTSDSIPYLQIELATPHVICAVATQGNSMADQWVETYQIRGSTNGLSWTTYSEKGQNKDFAGNFDRSSVVKHVLNEVLEVKYVRFISTSHHSTSCLRIELYGTTSSACRTQPVGIRWGSNIKDSHFKSSTKYGNDYSADNGRLYNSITAWAALTNTGTSDYLEIDLGSIYLLSGIATQGHPTESEWTITYKISLSQDGSSWNTYREDSTDKVFTGNTDRNTVVKQELTHVTASRFVRLNPLTYRGYKQMRVEVYGCQQGWRSSLGFEGGEVPDARISTSSISDQNHRASKGRLYGTSSWCASVSASGPSYLEVDLGKAQQISGVATQGDPGNAKWVTSYDLWFGYSNNSWYNYENVQANTDQHSAIVTWLSESVGARYVRLLPKTSNSGICLRMEVYGNEQVASPEVLSVTSSSNLTASVGSSTELTCRIYALPFVKIQWKNNGKHILRANRISSYADGFAISSLTANFTSADNMASVCTRLGQSGRTALYSSTFTCEAYYEGLVTSGPGRRSVHVYVELKVPKAPVNVTSFNVLDYSVNIRWAQAQASESLSEGVVKLFQIEYYMENNPSAKFTESVGAEVRSRFIGGLKTNTSYVVKIRAVSVVGESSWATLALQTTTPVPCKLRSLGMETGAVPNMYITSSSKRDSSTPPANAKLNYVGGSSWCASTSDSTPYLQIDFGSPHVICAVATQGNSIAEQWVQKYEIHFTHDGINWRPYVADGQVKIFSANQDRSTVVKHEVERSLVMRMLRFVPKSYKLSPCMRVELYGSGTHPGCADVPVGLQSKSFIVDHRFTASTLYDSNYMPWKGRLRGTGPCWAPANNNDANDYLQIDLGSAYTICSVATQGNPTTVEWTKTYQLYLSVDNVLWEVYQENGAVKIFPGNIDQNDVIKNPLGIPTTARFIRFNPKTYRAFKTLRVEVYGVVEECKESLGIENKGIQDIHMTSSSNTDNTHMASHGRLYGSSSWCSSTASITQFIQVDLGQVKTVTGIATQGDPIADKWVVQYAIRYSVEGNSYREYNAGETVTKVFQANKDKSGVVVNWLKYPIEAQYIRFFSVKWNGAICLRVDFYGCQKSCGDRSLGLESGAVLDSRISASSWNDSATSARSTRLHYTRGSSWCASTSDSTPYLQIDLGSPHVICGVATQGNYKANQWVKAYFLQTSRDGSNWANYTINSKLKVFLANVDRNTPVKHDVIEALTARYVRVNTISYNSAACLRLELYGSPKTVCEQEPVGIRYGGSIKDHRLRATTLLNNNYAPKMGRLNSPLAWATKLTNNDNDYLEVDLGSVYLLCGVATQGLGAADEWSKSYKVEMSITGDDWQMYQENGADKVFKGNTDRNTVVKHNLGHVTAAKFIRFYPLTFNTRKQLRVEVYGVVQGCRKSVGVEDGSVPDDKLLAASSLGINHRSSNSRLYGESAWCISSSPDPYLQIDLGMTKAIAGVATQGLGTSNSWVTSFELQFRFNATKWHKNKVTFQANKDKDRVKVNWLSEPIGARFVRIIPKTANNKTCMRVDVYGCENVASPRITQLVVNSNLTATTGSSADITCILHGEPFVDIRWLNKNHDITRFPSKPTYTDDAATSTLTVNYTTAEYFYAHYSCIRLDPSTRVIRCSSSYTCKAFYGYFTNNGPVEKSTDMFIEIQLPAAPSLPVISNVRSTSVKVYWDAPDPGDGSILFYKVQYSVSGHNISNEVNVTKNQVNRTHVTPITALRQYTRYNVRVVALSSIGEGLWSSTAEFRTYLPASIFVPSSQYILYLGKRNVTLHCYGQGFPLPILSWRKHGNPVVNATILQSNLTETNVSSHLYLRSGVTYKEAGNYSCYAINGVDGKGPVTENIEVLFKPEFTITPVSQMILDGGNVTFPCNASGVPQPSISWTFNGSAIPFLHSVIDGNLLVTSVENNNKYEGHYTCIATSRAGQARQTVTLAVDVATRVSNITGDTTVIAGDTITLTCVVEGDPYPIVRWEKNGSRNIPRATLYDNNRILEIKNVTITDEAVCTCVASNRAGNSTKSVQVIVKVPASVFISPPALRIFTKNDINKSIDCYGNGKPKPNVRWSKSNSTIPSVSSLSRNDTLRVVQIIANTITQPLDNVTSRLYLRTAGLTYNEAGKYTCAAANGVKGKPAQRNVEVIFRPILELASSDQIVLQGSDVTFECKSSGVPTPSIAWTFNGQAILWNHTVVDGTLRLKNVRNIDSEGNYTCTAYSRAGNTSYTAKLTVDVLPRIWKITGSTTIVINNQINLTCVVNGDPQPVVTWSKDGSSNLTRARLYDRKITLVIDNAIIEDEGKYRCVAVNRAGNTTMGVIVEIKVPVNIYVPLPHTRSFLRGTENTTIDCFASGYPKPSIEWRKGNKTIQKVDVLTLNDTRQVVQIVNSNIKQNLQNVSSRLYLRTAGISLEDAGNYTCVASNGFGDTPIQETVEVLFRPELVVFPENQTVLEGDNVTFRCKATGVPVPEVTWGFSGGRVQSVAINGSTLVVPHVKNTNLFEGTYTCNVINKVGSASASALLTIHTIPIITLPLQENIVVERSETVNFTCKANADPEPTYQWYKRGVLLSDAVLIDNNRTLKIQNVSVEDEGLYTCEASNDEGKANTSSNLIVHARPVILYELPRYADIVANNSLTLRCTAESIPAPNVTWMKNGKPLQANNDSDFTIRTSGEYIKTSTVTWSRVSYSDRGNYTCQFRNYRGKVESTTVVDICVPPRILTPLKDTSYIEGSTLTLTCNASGTPTPVVYWTKDGSRVIPRSELQISNTSLVIKDVRFSNRGTYRCVRKNRCANDTSSSSVTIFVPTTLYLAVPYTRIYRQGVTNVSIACYASAYPKPVVMWRRHNTIVPLVNTVSGNNTEHTVQVLFDDVQDHLQNVSSVLYPRYTGLTYKEAGNYTCVANNSIDQQPKKTSIELLFEPVCVTSPVNQVVIRGSNVTFQCVASGVPSPTITWTFNGGQILVPHFIKDVRLIITNIKNNNTYEGNYTCTASSRAGTFSHTATLTVDMLPRISKITGSTTIVIGNYINLTCVVYGDPQPVVTWRKDGSGNLTRARLYDRNRTLVIDNAIIEDEGEYRCVAVNRAGNNTLGTTVEIKGPVKIYVPRPHTRSFLRGDENTTIECFASGYPKPSIEWRKGNKTIQKIDVLTRNDSRQVVQIVKSNIKQNLQNVSSRLYLRTYGISLEDVGNYTCVASNGFGDTSIQETVEVLFRPELVVVPENQTVLEGVNVTFRCKATGVPVPEVTWGFSGGRVQSVAINGSMLVVPHVKNTNLFEGTYTCNVINKFGSASASALLTIHTIPIITLPLQENIVVERRETVNFTCKANADPEPTYQWYKRGVLLSDSVLIDNNRTLKIQNVSVEDEGLYTCEASNDEGKANTSSNLIVHARPVILYELPRYADIVANNSLKLRCIAESIPIPNVSWVKNGKPLQANNDSDFTIRTSGEYIKTSTVTWSRVSYSDRGNYTCQFRNYRGKVESTTVVDICVPPRILTPLKDTSYIEGSTLTLTCNASGKPTPVVYWTKDGSRVIPSAELQISNTSLVIKDVRFSDRGTYRCVTKNRCANDTSSCSVTIFVPTTLYLAVPYTRIYRQGVTNVSIACYASAYPKPVVMWRRHNNIVPLVNTVSGNNTEHTVQVLFDGIQDHLQNVSSVLYPRYTGLTYKEAGNYTCVANNSIDQQPKKTSIELLFEPEFVTSSVNQVVIGGSNVTFQCVASGVPSPTITWTFNGGQILVPHFIKDGRLIITNVKNNNTYEGNYMCTASSRAGTFSHTATLTVDMLPRISKITGSTTIVIGNYINLTCVVNGDPQPVVTWRKDGSGNLTRARLYDRNRTLVIDNAIIEDEGEYRCVAVNRAGNNTLGTTVEIKGPVKIYVPRPHTRSFLRGDENTTIECFASGYPKPSIEWRKGNKTIQKIDVLTRNDSRQVVQIVKSNIKQNLQNVSSRLYLRTYGISLEDAGNYTCVASNGFGDAPTQKTVEVLFRPELVVVPENQTVLEGVNVTFRCKATGVPVPEVTWSFSGGRVQSVAINGSTLVVPHVKNTNLFEGTYTCNVINRVGSAAASAQLTIHTVPTITLALSENLVVERSETVNLTCKADGDPEPTYRWYKGGVLLPDAVLLDNNRTLKIQNVSVKDEGLYTCEASNEEGKANTSSNLTVHAQPVILKELPGYIDIVANKSLKLRCTAESIPAPNVSWLKNAKPLKADNNSDFTIRTSGEYTKTSTVTWSRVSYSDKGNYTCQFRNYRGKVESTTVVDICVQPRILTPLKDTSYIEVSTLTLTCNASGKPTPVVYWTKDGSRVIPRAELQNGNTSLVIKKVTFNDRGIYRCVAKNRCGNDTSASNIDIFVPTTLYLAVPYTRIYRQGVANVSITCYASAYPKPAVVWRRHNTLVPLVNTLSGNNTERVVQVLFDDVQDHLLNVSSVLYPRYTGLTYKEAGNYTCVANNSIDQQPKKTSIELLFEPEFVTSPVNQVVIGGSNVTFLCVASGVPSPTITWKFNGGQILVPHLIKDGKLIITNVKNNNTYEGNYTCTASSRAGTFSHTATLTVDIRPRIINILGNNIVQAGMAINVTCVVEGDPLPRISWTKDSLGSIPKATLYQKNRTLVIYQAQFDDTGVYQSLAYSRAGNATRTITMDVQVSAMVTVAAPYTRAYAKQQKISISCHGNGNPNPSVEWTVGINKIPKVNVLTNNDTHRVVQLVSSNSAQPMGNVTSRLYLRVAGLTYREAGNYTCSSRNVVFNKTHIATNTLEVLFLPEFQAVPSNQVVLVNKNVLFSCNASGVPTPEIAWSFSGGSLPKYMIQGTNLFVYKVQNNASYEGNYTCTAQSRAGTAKHTAQLTVHVLPNMYVNLNATRVVERGSTVTLNCKATGDPEPAYEWTKDGARIVHGSNTVLQENNTILILVNVTSKSNGVYSCMAYNVEGNDSISTNLTVHAIPSIINGLLESITVVEGRILHLICIGEAIPVPTVKWTRNGKSVVSGSGGRFQIRSSLKNGNLISSLTLNNTRYEDISLYSCVFKNYRGNVTSTGRVTVNVPPFILQSPKSLSSLLENNVTFSCSVRGYPLPGVTWKKNGAEIPSSNRREHSVQIYNGTLNMTAYLHIVRTVRDDTGVYTCNVSNVAGTAEKNATLTILEKPDRLDLFVTSLSSTTARLQWSVVYNGNSPIIYYTVSYNNSEGDMVVRNLTSEHDLEHNFTDLLPATLYMFMVTATNAIGTSNLVIAVNTTLEAAPTAPRNLSITGFTANTISLAWTQPAIMNGILRAYLLKIFLVEDGNVTRRENITANIKTNEMQYTVGGLSAHTEYWMTISAVTIKTGNASNTVNYRTDQAKPGRPYDVSISFDREIYTVSWKTPKRTNGIITGYKVYFELLKQVEGLKNTIIQVEGSKTSATISLTTLHGDKTYTVKVQARTSKGYGDKSQDTVTLETPITKPPQPTPSPVPPEVSDTTVTIKIPKFSDINGPIKFYRVINVVVPSGTENDVLQPENITSSNLITYCDAHASKTQSAYLAVQFPASEYDMYKRFTLGSGKEKKCDRKKRSTVPQPNNGPLQSDTNYKAFTRAYTSNEKYSETKFVVFKTKLKETSKTGGNGGSSTGTAAGAVIVVIAIIAVVVFLIYWKRRSNQAREYELEERELHPIPNIAVYGEGQPDGEGPVQAVL